MQTHYATTIAEKLNLDPSQVTKVLALFEEGATIPFIARYRKEATGSMDEVSISNIRDSVDTLVALDQRKQSILKSLEERKLLTDKLKEAVNSAPTLTKLEDIYLPHKPKRRTKAMIAKEKGLEPLAQFIWDNQGAPYADQIEQYLNPKHEITTQAQALSGANDIMAEWISDDASARELVRSIFKKDAQLHSEVVSGKEVEGAKYQDYFAWDEPLAQAPSHRILAIRRGEKEGFLHMRLKVDDSTVLIGLESLFLKGKGPNSEQVKKAIESSYKRLIGPSIEAETRMQSKKKADTSAVDVFSKNLKDLLLAAPLGQKRVLAIDPGFRTGSKIVCLDAQGALLHNDVMYISKSERELSHAKTLILGLCNQFKIEAIAIGNGTASRETETFIRSLGLPKGLPVVVVNESGASIYSASEVAREEFPDQDITVRGSVSIGRRLMDPLAELVKLDAKSIGVGQYQHDVDQTQLKTSLDEVVMHCVNAVGVELNTASKQLLSYVSGLNATLAGNIVAYRNKHGPFKTREALKQVPRLGPKAFEQCAGFLRIRGGEQPLDASAVHPERYALVEQMTQQIQCDLETLLLDPSKRKQINLKDYVSDDVGLPTLQDIIQELDKPGRDPREQFECVSFSDKVHEMEDLKEGMQLPGVVTNVAAFGAFVDVGVHQDGLVHVSQLSDSFVSNPADVVKVGQKVRVTVVEVDIPRKRIALSMKSKVEKQVKSVSEAGRNNSKRQQNHTRNAPRQKSQSLDNGLFASALDNVFSKK